MSTGGIARKHNVASGCNEDWVLVGTNCSSHEQWKLSSSRTKHVTPLIVLDGDDSKIPVRPHGYNPDRTPCTQPT
ncbi:unnamed protein product [Dovyalis caffra]|uniref:Uncharacterized protein n=1 Tax=Dovyalis caffra TaxID=77055 RepID=A0AAV1QQD6_9ROSI|nr:unnamed protein product [Dovyalis caffra]